MPQFIELTTGENSSILINIEYIVSVDVYNTSLQAAVITTLACNEKSPKTYYPYETYEEIVAKLKELDCTVLKREKVAEKPAEDTPRMDFYVL